MKKVLVIILILSSNITFSQIGTNRSPFSILQIGVYGGFNFETFSEKGGLFIFEGKTNLTPRLNLKLSFGYYKSFQPTNYSIYSYGEQTIDSVKFYIASTYEVIKMIYDVFPFSLGFQYVFRNKSFSPYFTLDGSYNLISPSIERTGGYAWPYDSIDEIPDEFKKTIVLDNPNNSYGISVGAGMVCHISKNIGLDLRYNYKYDSEIINTHHIFVGIVF